MTQSDRVLSERRTKEYEADPGWSVLVRKSSSERIPDIAAFFDQLSSDAILTELALGVADGNILELVRQFLCADVMESGKYQTTRIGAPQGGVISPLPANIALNRMDQTLEQAGFRFVRYADDFVVLCNSRHRAKEAMELITRLLNGQMSLTLSPEKTRIATFKDKETELRHPRLSLMRAIPAGSPGAGKMHAGKWRETTRSRHRRG